jgi:hypothetical protein
MKHRFRHLSLALGLLIAAVTPALAAPDPDQMLISVYKDLGARHLRDALAKADALVTAYPTFQLGHLIHGDLLMMQRPTRSTASAPSMARRPWRWPTCARKRSPG